VTLALGLHDVFISFSFVLWHKKIHRLLKTDPLAHNRHGILCM